MIRSLAVLSLLCPSILSAKTPVLLGDFNAGPFSSSPSYLNVVGPTLYFTSNATGNWLLWTSDGTPEGTQSTSTEIGRRALVEQNGVLYYFDGNPVRLAAEDPSAIDDLIVFNQVTGTVVGPLYPFQYPIWGVMASVGTATTLVAEFGPFCVGPEICLYALAPHSFLQFAGAMHFIQTGALWHTDGTVAGTSSTRIPIYESPLRAAQGVEVLHDALYFPVLAGGPQNSPSVELWRSDGSAAGTSRAASLGNLNGPVSEVDVGIFAFVRAGDALFILLPQGDDGTSVLWRSDGTEEGTIRVARPRVERAPGLVALDDAILFSATDERFGSELWRSNGTAEGTVRISDINPGEGDANPSFLHSAGDRVFFGAFTPETGVELWQSDGTVAGTRMVADINPGPEGSDPQSFVASSDRLFFTAAEASIGRELWTLDLALCSGDCGYDDVVTVGDLVTAVRIALEAETVESCLPVDGNRDGAVRVDEIVRAIGAALTGC